MMVTLGACAQKKKTVVAYFSATGTTEAAAKEIAKELNLFTAEGGNAPIVFRKITPISELGDGKTVACDVEFETESTL